MDKRFIVNKEELTKHLVEYITKDTIVVCVGTKKVWWDKLAPMVGTLLKNNNFPLEVMGTMKDNVHAINLKERVDSIEKGRNIIAIDSAVGNRDGLGQVKIGNVPLHPGAGVDKELISVGDCSILGVSIEKSRANFWNYYEYGTKEEESMVKDMAFTIVDALMEACKKFY